jgi:hypothetical protein
LALKIAPPETAMPTYVPSCDVPLETKLEVVGTDESECRLMLQTSDVAAVSVVARFAVGTVVMPDVTSGEKFVVKSTSISLTRCWGEERQCVGRPFVCTRTRVTPFATKQETQIFGVKVQEEPETVPDVGHHVAALEFVHVIAVPVIAATLAAGVDVHELPLNFAATARQSLSEFATAAAEVGGRDSGVERAGGVGEAWYQHGERKGRAATPRCSGK